MQTHHKIFIKKFFHFGCVGAGGTLAQFMTLTALVELLAINPIIASDTGMVIGAVVNYFLSRNLVFNSAISHYKTAVKFFAIAAVGLLFNSTIMHAVLPYMPYLLAQIFATGIVLFWSFLANYYWTFNAKQQSA